MFPLVFLAKVNREEIRVMGLSSSEDRKVYRTPVIFLQNSIAGHCE